VSCAGRRGGAGNGVSGTGKLSGRLPSLAAGLCPQKMGTRRGLTAPDGRLVARRPQSDDEQILPPDSRPSHGLVPEGELHRAHAAHGLTIAQMAELVALGLRASEPRPRFSTIQATPKSGLTLRLVLWPHKFPLPCALASATY
jgi:hypothetical protein